MRLLPNLKGGSYAIPKGHPHRSNRRVERRNNGSTTGKLNHNQQGFTLLEFSLSLFLLAIAMLIMARWQHQSLMQNQRLSQQLDGWLVAEQAIEQLTVGQSVNNNSALGFHLKYEIHWQGRCRWIKVRVEGRQLSQAQLELFDCSIKYPEYHPQYKEKQIY